MNYSTYEKNKSLLIITDELGVQPKELFEVPGLSDRPLKKKFPKRKRKAQSVS